MRHKPSSALPSRQLGMSPITILIVIMVAIFFINAAIKVGPLYIESFSIDSSIGGAIKNGDFNKETPAGIKAKIAKYFDVNRIEGVDAKDIVISNNKGVLTIDATYERRVPLMANIDVVVKFDTLIYEVKPGGSQ